jgi:hypothetical protein
MERRRWVTAPSSVRSLVGSDDFFRDGVPALDPVDPDPLPRLALRARCDWGRFDFERLLY